MGEWYSNIYRALIFGSTISFLISFFSNGNVAYGSALAGYSVLILAVLMMLIIIFTNILKDTNNLTTFQTILTISMVSGPFLMMLGVIGFIMYLMINYQSIINAGQNSSSYYSFSNIAIVLFLIQIYLVYGNINNETFEKTGNLPRITSNMLMLIGILTLMCSLILFTILRYFTTDGFSNINILK